MSDFKTKGNSNIKGCKLETERTGSGKLDNIKEYLEKSSKESVLYPLIKTA